MTDQTVPVALDIIRNVRTRGWVELPSAIVQPFPPSVNLAPIVVPKVVTLAEDGVATFSKTALLVGASDPEGQTVTVSSVTYAGSDGTLVDNGDDTFEFTPVLNFVGNAVINFVVSDGVKSKASTYTIEYTQENDAPTAVPISLSMNENTTLRLDSSNLLTGATDPENDPLAPKSVTYSGSDGAVVDNGDNTFDFTPTTDFNGDVILGFTVTDGNLDSVSKQLTITVNDVPSVGQLQWKAQFVWS